MLPIVLTGMPGSGKTTISKLLANDLGIKYFDIDELIIENEQKSISEIFADFGERYFRQIEKQVVFNLFACMQQKKAYEYKTCPPLEGPEKEPKNEAYFSVSRMGERSKSMISMRGSCIISLGGGTFEDEETRKFLLKNSIVIYLKTTSRELFERVCNNKERPLLNKNMSIENLSRILEKREINYNQAHFIIDTTKISIEQVLEEVKRGLSDDGIKC